MTAQDDAVRAAIARFDRAFAAGDAQAVAACMTEDGQLLLLHREPIEGRAAIREHWERLFAEYDPGAWRTEISILDVHGNRAYAVSTYSETLVHRAGGPSRVVHGRLVRFLRQDPGDPWLVTLALNSHVRPVEQVPHGAAPGRPVETPGGDPA